MPAAGTVGDLLRRLLAAAGIRRLWTDADTDPATAALLADAAGRVGPAPGAALLPGGLLRISSEPGGHAAPVEVDEARQLPEALAAALAVARGAVPSTAILALHLDLAAPAPEGLDPNDALGKMVPPPSTPPPSSTRRLGSSPARTPLVLAGPGVFRSGAVAGLRALAAAGRLGVANTWGAKGVFEWQSPHHLGTLGLQARDAELGGVHDAELVLTTGLDPGEWPASAWARPGGGQEVVEVDPRELGALAQAWRERTHRRTASMESIERPPLYRLLADVVRPLYLQESVPLSPGRAVADLAAALSPGELVVADPGPAGLWVARAFPTSEPGSALVPAAPVEGFAAAAALACHIAGRPAIAVTTSPIDPATEAVCDVARRLGASLVVEAWGDSGRLSSAADHAGTLAASRRAGGVEVIEVPVDLGQTDLLVAVAGEVTAWPSA